MAKREDDEKAKALPKPAAKDIQQQCDDVGKSLSIQRYRTAMVLANYYGSQSLVGASTTGNGVSINDALLPSTKYRAIESLTHQNGMRAVIDTMLSQLVRVPDVRVQTIGGTWGQQRSARKIGQWLSGSLKRCNFGQTLWQVAADSATTPLAGVRLWFEEDGAHVERVRPDQVRYNPKEGKKPRNLWLRYGVDVDELVAMYPEHEKFLRDEKTPKYKEDALYQSLDLCADFETDQVEVTEHWLRASNGKTGWHTVVVGDRVLKQCPWKYDFFGFIELVDCPSWNSYAGHSLGEQLLPYQLTINRKTRTIDTAQARLSIGRVYLPKGSEIEKQHFSRTPGEFIEFNNMGGGQPVIQTAQACSGDYYARLEKDEAAMWELAGVSKSQGTGTIPRGMEGASGKAQREYNDTAATRLKSRADGLDSFVERVCTALLAMAIDWYAGDGAESKGRIVAAAGTKVLEQVDFKVLDVKETSGIQVRCISVSGLPQHPSARLEYVKELVEAGFVNRRYGTKMLSIPDSEKWEDVQASAFELATFHVECCLYDGKRASPESNREYLEILQDMGSRELMDGVRLGAPEKNLELLRRLLATGDDLLKKMPGQGAGPAAAPSPLAQLNPMGQPNPAMQAALPGVAPPPVI
jgi:hypothetical protein